jgi:hypothetical protein
MARIVCVAPHRFSVTIANKLKQCSKADLLAIGDSDISEAAEIAEARIGSPVEIKTYNPIPKRYSPWGMKR